MSATITDRTPVIAKEDDQIITPWEVKTKGAIDYMMIITQFGCEPITSELIKSWEEVLPEYTITCWNEDNSELDCRYVQQAYQEKQWAFVSDYKRLKALSQEGGI